MTDNSAVSGGGIAATGARLWIEDSTIDNNTATNGGGAIMTETFARLFQVTVDGNNGGSGVGGVDLAAGQLQLVSSVVADDAVSLGLVNGSALFINSIVDAPTGCAAGGASVTSQGRNITRDATCGLTGTGDQADTNPLLRPLGDNDGPVPTRLPELNSPAVDAISPGALGCAMPAHPDGRQKPRPVRAGCDIGPVELGGCIIDGVFVENTKAHQFECDALMALYDSTNGPSWTSSAGWGTPTDVCSWYGIACNEDSRPFSLALQNNGLDGTIPPEISGLAAFSGLTLSGDELTGSIPVEVGELVNLRTLALFDTQLSGPIPTEIGNLSDLQYLQLSDNALTGSLPPTLGGLSELLRLQVDGNELSGEFPPALGNLSKLWYLDLRGNSFSGPLPPEFGNLDSLFQAALWDNQFSGDITAAIAGVQDTLVVFLRLISDGPGGNNCLTVTDPGVAAWLDSVDQDWDECDAP
ncbi:MAG: choice-of-anchor Q domain-containing protein [Acidimicrobiales bacterium]